MSDWGIGSGTIWCRAGTVEEGSSNRRCSALRACSRTRRYGNQANRLALGVRTVKFADSFLGIVGGFVGYVGDAFGAASTVVREGKLHNGADAAKKIL